MKQFSKYAVMLIALLAMSHSAFAEKHATPLECAQQIADLIASGPHDPSPAIPASDIVTRQLDARLR